LSNTKTLIKHFTHHNKHNAYRHNTAARSAGDSITMLLVMLSEARCKQQVSKSNYPEAARAVSV